MKPTDIVFTADQFTRLQAHLFQENEDEQAAYAFVSPAENEESLRLLVHHIIPLTREDFIEQSGTYLEVQPGVAAQIAQLAIEDDYGLIEIHSHPFADDDVVFSATDTEYALPRFRWFAEQVGRSSNRAFHHAMLVFGVNSADALYYDRQRDVMQPARRVVVLDSPLRVMPIPQPEENAPAPDAPTADDRYGVRISRQIAAFGAEGQRRLGEIKVGIVGLGGIGCLIANELALLGVRQFVLIDADQIDVTNLNRFVGATLADAEAGKMKVEVVARAIHDIDPHAKVTQITAMLPAAETMDILKDMDVLFGCTDTHGSRLLLNSLSVQYLMPYIDTGVGIFTDGNGRITEAGGQFRVMLPGKFCLNCIDAIDTDQAMRDLLPPEARVEHQARGYIPTEDIPAPSVVFLNATLASLAVGEFLNLIAPYRDSAAILYYFLLTQELRKINAVRNPDCVVCGTRGRLALGDLEQMPGVEAQTKITPPPIHPSGK